MTLRNRQVQTPLTPLGLRREHIAEFETLLWIAARYAQESAAEFTINHDSDDTTLFTVTGKKYSARPVREFRDETGLPMFEVERARPGLIWKKPWRVRLPGSEEQDQDLAEIKTRVRGSDFDISFRNACALAQDAKKKNERDLVTVQVRRVSALCAFAVFAGGRKVVDVRESPTRNRTISGFGITGWTRRDATRGVMEILVADDFDLALASLIAVIICDRFYRDTPPTRGELEARERRLNPRMV